MENPNPNLVECIRNAIIAFQRGALTQADLLIRIDKSKLPEEWRRALINSPSLSTLNKLTGSGDYTSVRLPTGREINIDPPVIIALRTKTMAAQMINKNIIVAPWRGPAPSSDIVAASVAKVLSAVAARRLLEAGYGIIIASRDGALERALWALATADGMNVTTIGRVYVPPRVEGDTITAQVLGSAVTANLKPHMERVGRAIRHWIKRGGSLSRLIMLTDLEEEDIPSSDYAWYTYGRGAENIDEEEMNEIVLRLIQEGIDLEAARTIARAALSGTENLDALRVIATTIAYHYPAMATNVAKDVAKVLGINETALVILIKSIT